MLLERYFVLFLLIVSAVFLVMSFELPLYSMNVGALGSGFFPRIMSILLVILLGIYFIQLLRGKSDQQAEGLNKQVVLKQIILVVALIATLFLVQIIGMLPSIGLFMFMMLTFVLKIHWLKSLIFTISVLIVMYGIFVLWLESPLPKGVFG